MACTVIKLLVWSPCIHTSVRYELSLKVFLKDIFFEKYVCNWVIFELFFYSLKIFYLMKVDFELANFSSWQPSPLWYYKDFLQISNIHNNHDDQSKIVEKIPIDGQIANSWKKVSIFSYDMITVTPKTQFCEPLFSEILDSIEFYAKTRLNFLVYHTHWVIFCTEILTGKVVLWFFFLSETSEKIHNSTF